MASALSAYPLGFDRLVRFAAAALSLALVLLAAPAALAESRVALVIGNGGYRSVPQLANPPNDARDVADALKALGFSVTLGIDLDQDQMERTIAGFALSAAQADVSLFYYGGHGMQVATHNYLIPVDAQLHTPTDIERRTVAVDSVFDALSKNGGIHLVFLDACRDNPFKDFNIAARVAGLARVGDAAGFLIAFATQPDNVAYDGGGRNSPFARAFLSHVGAPGADVSSMMIAVRRDVIAATGGAQIPWENSSLTRQFYFAGEENGDSSPEALLWRLAGGDRDPGLLSIYLERYPDGAHAADVRALLGEIGPTSKPAPASARAGVEDLLWRLALSGRESRLIELYLARYPAGAHVREAQTLLASLKDAESAADDPGIVCDRLATHPHDATAATQGVELQALQADAAAAIGVCTEAVARHPEVAHYEALLARAEAASGRMDQAYALYRKAADAGDARAMYSLGLMLETGDHVQKDLKGAYALYEKAAERGLADGAINLAVALAEGKAIDKNLPRAYALLQQASQAGSPRATYDLAEFAEHGYGGKLVDALDLYRRAAELGFPKGWHTAAALLDEGRGVAKDPASAATELLRAVAGDSGESVADLTGKAQIWSPATVKALQSQLAVAGYYSGPIDGKSGPALGPALRQWRLLGGPQKS
ncbi:MAG: peptidase C14, caspase catalytic subunit p20 [Bradyrhizobium sp.]|nr:MAG: peptidase C14, caspase catalytic subunit p20 [Bradyrhizobium sp.]